MYMHLNTNLDAYIHVILLFHAFKRPYFFSKLCSLKTLCSWQRGSSRNIVTLKQVIPHTLSTTY